MTKWQYKHVLERLRQQINNLRTQLSRIHEQSSNGSAPHSGADRITPANAEYDIPMLYDNRTAAQRWSHFVLDILETGLVLTSFDSGLAQETINTEHPEDLAPSGAVIPGLGQLINVSPSVTIGLQYADLAGTYLDLGSDNPNVQAEISALIEGRKAFPSSTITKIWAWTGPHLRRKCHAMPQSFQLCSIPR